MKQSSSSTCPLPVAQSHGPGTGRGRRGLRAVLPGARGHSRRHGRGGLPQATLDGLLQSAHLGPQCVHGVSRNGHPKGGKSNALVEKSSYKQQ